MDWQAITDHYWKILICSSAGEWIKGIHDFWRRIQFYKEGCFEIYNLREWTVGHTNSFCKNNYILHFETLFECSAAIQWQ